MNKFKRIALFGSTGSIGTQTLDIIDRLGGYKVVLLSAGSNWKALAEQALKWMPERVVIGRKEFQPELERALSGSGVEIQSGEDDLSQAAKTMDFDLCVNGLVGVAGLLPSYFSLKRGIDLALANKESLVMAGDLLNRIMLETGARMFPIDSEHSAIQQCLQGEKKESVKRLILTASGGPFREWSLEEIQNATPAQALMHPTWKMGPKITIDSATLMNKGLEIIEAYQLFNIPLDKIDVKVHPVSIVHSMVEFVDGSFKAQLGKPDMRIPIQYALTYPDHKPLHIQDDDPVDWPPLQFFKVDREKYPCLGLAYRAMELGGTASAVLNGADEAAVAGFLEGKISFGQIADLINLALDSHTVEPGESIKGILNADKWARQFVKEQIVN